MSMSIAQTRDLLLQSASLRAHYKFDDAVALIEAHLPDVHEDLRENAMLEAVYAALESGNRSKAIEHARKLAELDPDIPTVRRLLANAPV